MFIDSMFIIVDKITKGTFDYFSHMLQIIYIYIYL